MAKGAMKDEYFEWDDNKASANERKHGVSFEDARESCQDQCAFEIPDEREFYGEARTVLTGRAGIGILIVVITRRNGRIRIISARRAEPHESRRYYAGKYPSRR